MRAGITVMVVIAAVGFVGGATAVNRTLAYNNSGDYRCGFAYSGQSTLAIPWKNDSANPPTGIYQTVFDQAQESWNVGPHPAYFQSSTLNHKRAAKNDGTGGPRGHIDRYCGDYRDSTAWYVNKQHPQLTDPVYGDFWKQSAAAHESGHHIWASHSNVSDALMNSNRGTLYNGPIQDDNCAIQQRYPSTAWPLQCGYSGGP